MSLLNTILAIIVSATIDSTTIFIGDQTDLHLQATFNPHTEHVSFPVYGESLVSGIEIVDRTVVDTLLRDDNQVRLDQYLTITSFKDSLFYIEPIPFVCNGDTVYSDPVSLNVVQPFELDTADSAITDIKKIYSAPLWWWGIVRWILLAIVCMCIVTGICFLVIYIKRRRNGTAESISSEPLRPAEEIAIEKLDKIKEEKIWKEGQTKLYHTQLTDVLREYISNRYAICSSEKTSEETLRAMRPILSEKKDLYIKLEKVLRLADLVKFAKWTTTPDENESCLSVAYIFVHETTPEDQPDQMEDSEDDRHTESKDN